MNSTLEIWITAMNLNSTLPLVQQKCNQRALFLSHIDNHSATYLWTAFTIPLQFFFLLLTCIMSHVTVYNRTLRSGPVEEPTTSAQIHRGFLTTTIAFGINILVFLLICLLLQAQRFCAGDANLGYGDYIVEWVLTSIVSGGVLGTAAVFWINALVCLSDLDHDPIKSWRFILFETCLVFSPLILIGMMCIAVVEGPAACANVFSGFGKRERRQGSQTWPAVSGSRSGDLESSLSRASTAVPLDTFSRDRS